ncbi:MAG: hypothetical protein J6A01_00190 [Proteobacteria bacterium]|nr:hypothetical protein [Pseudomonadota bacterium]
MSKDETQASTTVQHNEEEERIAALSRRLRHIGFAIFGGLALVTALFLAYCVITSMNENLVFDPFTGERVSEE